MNSSSHLFEDESLLPADSEWIDISKMTTKKPFDTTSHEILRLLVTTLLTGDADYQKILDHKPNGSSWAIIVNLYQASIDITFYDLKTYQIARALINQSATRTVTVDKRACSVSIINDRDYLSTTAPALDVKNGFFTINDLPLSVGTGNAFLSITRHLTPLEYRMCENMIRYSECTLARHQIAMQKTSNEASLNNKKLLAFDEIVKIVNGTEWTSSTVLAITEQLEKAGAVIEDLTSYTDAKETQQ